MQNKQGPCGIKHLIQLELCANTIVHEKISAMLSVILCEIRCRVNTPSSKVIEDCSDINQNLHLLASSFYIVYTTIDGTKEGDKPRVINWKRESLIFMDLTDSMLSPIQPIFLLIKSPNSKPKLSPVCGLHQLQFIGRLVKISCLCLTTCSPSVGHRSVALSIVLCHVYSSRIFSSSLWFNCKMCRLFESKKSTYWTHFSK